MQAEFSVTENSACIQDGEKHICKCNVGFEAVEDKACAYSFGNVVIVPVLLIAIQQVFLYIKSWY
jgi:hypothetical protein